MPGNTLGYPVDIFVSYTHNPMHKEWVGSVLLPELRPRLADDLKCREPALSVYWDDDLRTGEDWSQALKDKMAVSCCMVGIWSTYYFGSRWCVAEWQSFARRTGKSAVAPLKVHGGDDYPPGAMVPQHNDFIDYFYTGPAFRSSLDFFQFQKKVRRLSSDLSAMIKGSDPFTGPLPIVDPDTVNPSDPAPIQRLVLGAA